MSSAADGGHGAPFGPPRQSNGREPLALELPEALVERIARRAAELAVELSAPEPCWT